MAKKRDLFEHNYNLEWPDQEHFPINEATQDRRLHNQLQNDIENSTQYLIVTGFTSLTNLIEFFGVRDQKSLKEVKIVIGFEPDERISKKLPYYSLPTEIKNYWLKENISIKLCSPILNFIEKIKSGIIKVKVLDKLHAKIYVGDNSLIMGSSNFSKNGITKQKETNIRVNKTIDKKERYQYDALRKIAENYYAIADDYTDQIISLLRKTLKDANWEEALARALSEVLESKWMKDFPEIYNAVMSKELWPSQRVGIAKAMRIIQEQGNVLIADPTGSGKTKLIVALAYTIFHWLWENGKKNSSNALIISPKQVITNWNKEEWGFNLFNRIESMGKLSVSDEKKSRFIKQNINNTSILIIDEAHNFLNKESNRSRAVTPKSSTHVILATATPINKKADDLLRLVELLDIDNLSDEHLKTYRQLRSRKKKIDEEYLNSLRGYINQFIIRRTKKDLNKMIEKERHLYINTNNKECKYPETTSKIYKVHSGNEDNEIAQRIFELAEKLKGVMYLQKLSIPDYYDSEDEMWKYFNNRIKTAPALAKYSIRSSMRSSHCALIEHIYGTEFAKKIFEVKTNKNNSGNVLASLKKAAIQVPDNKIDERFFGKQHEWLINYDKYKKVCENEINIYNSIGELAKKLSGKREMSKAFSLKDAISKYKKVLAFDSTVITLNYLKKLLEVEERDFEVIVATGQSETNKKNVRDIFSLQGEDKKVIALCSDAMSEGVNLQDGKVLYLLDMPSVLRIIEQRIGRIERMDSEHSEIFVYWPEDAPEFSLSTDKKILETLSHAGKVIGNNVVIPKEIYDKYFQDDFSVKNMIEAYKSYSSEDFEWQGIKDSTQSLYDLIDGDKSLISVKLYEEFKDVDATVKTAISFIESDKTWSFFSFKGDSKRSPKWVLVDEEYNVISDFSEIAEKLFEYLKNSNIIQRRWEGVEVKKEIDSAIFILRKIEFELLAWKKKRALRVAKRIINDYLKNKNLNINKEKIFSIKETLENIESSLEIDVDVNHYAELWLKVFQPKLDELRANRRNRKKIITLDSITKNNFTLDNETIDFIIDQTKLSSPPDELLASCIISIKK